MYATVRRYRTDGAFASELVRRRQDVEKTISGVPGFDAYYLIRTDDGVISVTVCDDRAGTEESTRRAGAWVRENLPAFAGSPPEVTSGDVVIETARRAIV